MIRLILSCTVILISCNKPNTVTTHPTEENLHPDIEITNIISDRIISNSDDSSYIEKLAHRIQNHKVIFELGKEVGKSYEMLGDVEDVAVSDNNIFILDSQNNGINQFDSDGNYISTVSSKGKGPGEFINPISIHIQNNKLYLLNENFRINIYSINNNSDTDFNEVVDTDYPPLSICTINNLLFVQSSSVISETSLEDKNSIYVYDMNNQNDLVNRFGAMYKSSSWSAIYDMSKGGIECDPNTKQVLHYFNKLNFIYSYSIEGELIWTTKFENYNFLKIVEWPNRIGVDINNLQDDYDQIENLILLNKDYFIVQISNKTMTLEATTENSLKTYILNIEDGSGRFIGSDVPKIISANSDVIVFLQNENYPIIKISEY